MARGKQAQALAIKLSRERRAGKEVPAPLPPKGQYSEHTRKRAMRDLQVGRHRKKQGARKRIG